MRVLLALVVTAACGSSQPTARPPQDPGEACEPGRCLSDISAKIAEHRPESRACFEAGAKKTPGLAGRIIINFRIDPDGNVIDASQGMQDDQITEEDVVTCVTDVLKKVTFAKSPSGKTTRAYHQFEFGSNGNGGT